MAPRCATVRAWWRRGADLLAQHKSVYLWLLVSALAVCASVDYVLYTRLTKQLQLYAFPLMQTVYPLAIALISLACSLAARRCGGRGRGAAASFAKLDDVDAAGAPLETSSGAEEEDGGDGARPPAPSCCRAPVWRAFLVLAALDGLTNAVQFLPMVYLGGPLLVVLGQFHLVALLLMSALYLGRRYRFTHYVAVPLLILAVCVALMPAVLDTLAPPAPPCPGGAAAANATAGANATAPAAPPAPARWLLPLWVAIFLASSVPHAFSHVFQERTLKEHDVAPLDMLAGVALLQIAFSVPFIFALFVPLPAPAVTFRSLADLLEFLADTARCVAGAPMSARGAASGVQCAGAWPVFAAFLVVNLFFNLAQLALTKHTSANMSAVAGVLRLAVGPLLFAWPWLADVAYRVATPHEVLGLLLAVIAIAIFRYRPERHDRAREGLSAYEPAHDRDRARLLRAADDDAGADVRLSSSSGSA